VTLTSYRTAALAAASSANALLSLLAYLPELDEEQVDEISVAECAWRQAEAQRRRRHSRPPVNLSRRLPS
jgi:hypothetical protein